MRGTDDGGSRALHLLVGLSRGIGGLSRGMHRGAHTQPRRRGPSSAPLPTARPHLAGDEQRGQCEAVPLARRGRQLRACTELCFGRSIVVYDPGGKASEAELSPRSALAKRVPAWMMPSLASSVLHQAGAAVSQATSSTQARGILHGLKHGHSKKPRPPLPKSAGHTLKPSLAAAVAMTNTQSDTIKFTVEL